MKSINDFDYTGPGNIHMIHLDNDSWNPLYSYNVKTWKKNYPNCDFKLWQWSDVLPIIEKSNWCKKWLRYFKETKYPIALAMLSDYLRLYILNIYGGLYIDTDVFSVNEIPSEAFRTYNMIVAWDPGIRKFFESDYIKKHNIEKTGLKQFWRERSDPIINNGSFFFSKPNVDYLKKEMDYRDTKIEEDCNILQSERVKVSCISLSDRILKENNISVENYQKTIIVDNILIINSNFNAFEPEEMYFDYNKKYPIYNVHQCMCTGYNKKQTYKVVEMEDIFKELVDFDFSHRIIYMIPIKDNFEEFNDLSYNLRQLIGPHKKWMNFSIKPMPSLD